MLPPAATAAATTAAAAAAFRPNAATAATGFEHGTGAGHDAAQPTADE